LNDTPIAFVSSLKGDKELQHASDIGAADYIFKPFDKDDLLDRVKALTKET
jgi:DNA-binding response OmpR family regulator